MKKNDSTEKRRQTRRPLGVAGTIHLPDGNRLACKVSNISQTGALLTLEMPAELPPEFVLEIGRDAGHRRCHRLRQNGLTAGVRFPDRPLQGR